MKKIEEIIREIEGSEELRKEYEAIEDMAGLEALLKKLDCEATADEFIKYLDENAASEGAISDDAAEAVAGGGLFPRLKLPVWEKRTKQGPLVR